MASLDDLALVWAVLSGHAVSPFGSAPRIARLGGRFRENADPAQLAAIAEGAMEMEEDDEEEEEEAAPKVDPDGWETVARGKKTKGKRR